jgi:hypothetical protein
MTILLHIIILDNQSLLHIFFFGQYWGLNAGPQFYGPTVVSSGLLS